MDVKRVLKRRVKPALDHARSVRFRGNARECPCCGGRFAAFLPVGTPQRPDALCPRCGSRERHRIVAVLLEQRPQLADGRVLHFAPEPTLTRVLSRHPGEYVTSDFGKSTADVRADITKLPFGDDRWDFILCSHVLEHVVDDRSAMSELRRVLAPGGRLLCMVPRNRGVPTDEDPSVTDEAERRRRFGQEDHVRIYGDDLEDRLRAAGFEGIEDIALETFDPARVQRNRLRAIGGMADEATLICS